MVGTIGGIVTCANDNDAGVTAWLWTMESVPLGSAVPTGPMATTPTIGFVPDIAGSFLVSCHVTGMNTTDVDTDYRVFSVRNTMQWIIPAFHGNADAHNFGGQTRGWAGTATYQMLDSLFGYITTMLTGASPGDVLTYNGGVWHGAAPASDPYEAYQYATTSDGNYALMLDKNNATYLMPTPATYCSAAFHALICGVGEDSSQCTAILTGTAQRGLDPTTTAMLTTTIDYIDKSDANMSVIATGDNTLGGIYFLVRGKAGVNMKWTAAIEIAQAYFPVP